MILSADSGCSVPKNCRFCRPLAGNKKMKQEADKKTTTTDRDDTACTTQPYRLICIHNPVTKTGRRILIRSATAVIQTGEQPAGFGTCRPEIPAVSGPIRPSGPTESNEPMPHMPAEPQTMVSGLPEGFRKSGPGIPAGTVHIGLQGPAGNREICPPAPEQSATLMPQEPAGKNKTGAENPAPGTTGAGTV